ncbi:hypothetical protein TNCV_2000181 [Trichonephila clavipes]|nr:hypothetical protein TNCV_2000181 [Trichonephila clavipes]
MPAMIRYLDHWATAAPPSCPKCTPWTEEAQLCNISHVFPANYVMGFDVAVHNAAVQHPISTVSLQTRIQPSWCCRQMRDSSVNTTAFHSAAHILLSSHHWRWIRLWFCVKGRPSNGRLADRPLYFKRRRMGRVVVYRACTPHGLGSINGLGKIDSAFHPRYIGSINEYQAYLGS